MSIDSQDLEELRNMIKDLSFVNCVIHLTSDQVVFAAAAMVDEQTIITSDPLIVKKSKEKILDTRTETTISFSEYCPYTSDRYTLFRKDTVLSINSLSDESSNAYKSAIQRMYGTVLHDEDEMLAEESEPETDSDLVYH